MAFSKKTIILALAFLAITNIALSQHIVGGWTNYQISSNFKSDASSPLYKAYYTLSSKLQESAISDIKFTSAQSQVVNGMNFKLTFTYLQDNTTKQGNCVVYIPFSGESCEVTSLELQPFNLQAPIVGGYSDYTIESGYKSDSQSPLNMIEKSLNEELSHFDAKFSKFIKAQSQVVNGLKMKIQFTFIKKNGLQQQGSCVAYIKAGEMVAEIQELNVKQVSLESAGGWENYKFDTNFQADPKSPLTMAFNALSLNLKNENLELVKFNQVKAQIVNGINFMVLFTYKREGKEMTGICKIFVNARENQLSIKDLQFNDEGMRLQQSNEVEGPVAGGYTEIVFNPSSLEESNSFIAISYKKMQNKLQQSKLTLMKVIKLEQQVVGGVNMRFTFLYRDQMSVKVGSCVVYAQPWLNSYEVVSMKLNGDVQMA